MRQLLLGVGMERVVVSLVPLLVALALSVVAHSAGTAVADLQLLWAVAIGSAALVAVGIGGKSTGLNREAREVEARFVQRLDEVTIRVREALHDGDALRRSLDRFSATQAGAAEKLASASSRTVEAAVIFETRNEAELQSERQLREAARSEASIRLEALLDHHGVLCLMSEALEAPPSLAQLRRDLDSRLERMGFRLVGAVGERIDDALHRVVESIDTPTAEVDATVAVVRKPGFVFNGECVRRAEVVEHLHTPPDPPAEARQASQTASGELDPSGAGRDAASAEPVATIGERAAGPESVRAAQVEDASPATEEQEAE